MMLHRPFKSMASIFSNSSGEGVAAQSSRRRPLAGAGSAWPVWSWALWSLPWPALLYVLVVDAAALAAFAMTFPAHIGLKDLLIASLISGAMLAHQYLSRVDERIHRTLQRSPQIDLGWVWIFPGALLLPPSLAVALTLLTCALRWWFFSRMDGRPHYRYAFNAAVWALCTAAASAVVAASGRREHLSSDPGGWADLALMLLAAGTAFLLNSALIAGVLALATGARRRQLFAGRDENLLDLGTLLLGICVALAVSWWPPFVALVVLPAVMLHRTVRIQHLEVAVRTDDKTGVLNALAFHQEAGVELARSRRLGRSMAIFMVDMDGFKQVNDEHGHLVGDAVLQRVARVLASEVRRTDAVGRVGGDEFAVLLPAIDVTEALAVAERIRVQVRQIPVPIACELSTSIGVAVYPRVAAESVEGLVAAADAALYEAKRAGRDRTCLASRQRVPAPLPPSLPSARAATRLNTTISRGTRR